MMVALPLLAHRDNLAAEAVVQGRHENLYWMAFCGLDVGTVLEQAKPGQSCRWVDPSTWSQWCRRLGTRGTRGLAQVVPQQLAWEPGLRANAMAIAPTTQEKHVADPTATALGAAR
jgi:Transposase domain (DUF772)